MKYEIIIYWSNLDDCFIAEVPQLEGLMAHGNTDEEALKNVKEAAELYIETLSLNKQHIPIPKGERLMFA